MGVDGTWASVGRFAAASSAMVVVLLAGGVLFFQRMEGTVADLV